MPRHALSALVLTASVSLAAPMAGQVPPVPPAPPPVVFQTPAPAGAARDPNQGRVRQIPARDRQDFRHGGGRRFGPSAQPRAREPVGQCHGVRRRTRRQRERQRRRERRTRRLDHRHQRRAAALERHVCRARGRHRSARPVFVCEAAGRPVLNQRLTRPVPPDELRPEETEPARHDDRIGRRTAADREGAHARAAA